MYKILGKIFRKTNLFQCLRTAVSSFHTRHIAQDHGGKRDIFQSISFAQHGTPY